MTIITVLGIDLAKNIFHLHGVDEHGKPVLKKRLNRKQLSEFMVNLRPCLVGMEACSGANFWARQLRAQGHEVKIMAPQFVKPYRKNSKNDFNDAEAICEAVTRPNMRFVPIKETVHQDVQSIHRIRARIVSERTALANEIRGLLQEYGVVIPEGISKLRKTLPIIIEDLGNGISVKMRDVFKLLQEEISELDEKVGLYDDKIKIEFKANEVCQRIAKIEGIGPITATAIFATLANPALFKNGRQFAASIGLVPGQDSTGGEQKLLPITKRGNIYVRQLLIHGARSFLKQAPNGTDRKSRWAAEKIKTRGFNRACVAVANKNARTIWALMARGTQYEVAA